MWLTKEYLTIYEEAFSEAVDSFQFVSLRHEKTSSISALMY